MMIRTPVMVVLRTADLAWLGIGAIVFSHNIVQALRGGEQLSDAVGRYSARHPVITPVIISITAAHLARRLPHWADPWFLLFGVFATIARKRHK